MSGAPPRPGPRPWRAGDARSPIVVALTLSALVAAGSSARAQGDSARATAQGGGVGTVPAILTAVGTLATALAGAWVMVRGKEKKAEETASSAARRTFTELVNDTRVFEAAMRNVLSDADLSKSLWPLILHELNERGRGRLAETVAREMRENQEYRAQVTRTLLAALVKELTFDEVQRDYFRRALQTRSDVDPNAAALQGLQGIAVATGTPLPVVGDNDDDPGEALLPPRKPKKRKH